MLNIALNLLGVATLGLPFAMAQAGALFSCLSLAIAVKSSFETWKILLTLSAFGGGRLSYPEIGRRVLGAEANHFQFI